MRGLTGPGFTTTLISSGRCGPRSEGISPENNVPTVWNFQHLFCIGKTINPHPIPEAR